MEPPLNQIGGHQMELRLVRQKARHLMEQQSLQAPKELRWVLQNRRAQSRMGRHSEQRSQRAQSQTGQQTQRVQSQMEQRLRLKRL